MTEFLLALVPVMIGALTPLLIRMTTRRLAPSLAAVLLTTLALTIALATGALLCLAAVIAVAELAPVITLGHWSPEQLRERIPMPSAVGAVGGIVALLLLGSAVVYCCRVVVQARRASAAASLVPSTSGFVLVDDVAAFAYAVPGQHRRIVASTGMLKSLTGPQRRALLAHEDAHLRHHHHLYVQLGRLAAAANPLVRPVSAAIDLAVERWADETAAREVGDRLIVAKALSAAAAGMHWPTPAGSLAGADTNVIGRVRALVRPTPSRRSAAAVLATAVATCWLAAVVVVIHVHALMELAETVR